MLSEAIILAGGFGTRLRHVLAQVPKPMAPVGGKPFLCLILDYLLQQGISHVVLATGYKHEYIENYFSDYYRGIAISYSEEKEPLLTGGAIRKACQLVKSERVLVLNGDTIFPIGINLLAEAKAPIAIALRQVADTSRYGAVDVDDSQHILSFREKTASNGAGLINGGVYVVDKKWLLDLPLPQRFSFENELLQPMAAEGLFAGVTFNDYFIDIGIEEDYRRACNDYAAGLIAVKRPLFLDRDGVINRHIEGDYVRRLDDFEWIEGIDDCWPRIRKLFAPVMIVTNQQGVGKGLFSRQNLDAIHHYMTEHIASKGGQIDKVYVCTSLEQAADSRRKPNIGMALEAQQDFCLKDLTQSVMIGDSLSDMLFGYRAGMYCVYLTNAKNLPPEVNDMTDMVYTDLSHFLNSVYNDR